MNRMFDKEKKFDKSSTFSKKKYCLFNFIKKSLADSIFLKTKRPIKNSEKKLKK